MEPLEFSENRNNQRYIDNLRGKYCYKWKLTSMQTAQVGTGLTINWIFCTTGTVVELYSIVLQSFTVKGGRHDVKYPLSSRTCQISTISSKGLWSYPRAKGRIKKPVYIPYSWLFLITSRASSRVTINYSHSDLKYIIFLLLSNAEKHITILFNTGVLSGLIKTSAMKRYCILNLGIAKFILQNKQYEQKNSLKRTLGRSVLLNLAKGHTSFNITTCEYTWILHTLIILNFSSPFRNVIFMHTITLSEAISYLDENHTNINWKYPRKSVNPNH